MNHRPGRLRILGRRRGDDFIGRIIFYDSGLVQSQSSIGGAFVTCPGVTCTLTGSGTDVRVTVAGGSSGVIPIRWGVTDSVDSLGRAIAVGVDRDNVFQYTQSQRQAGMFTSQGAITDLALSPDGATIYATADSGRINALRTAVPNPARFRATRCRSPLNSNSPTGPKRIFSIKLHVISPDGSKVLSRRLVRTK
ncbi:MAG: hypothetical protein R3C05_29820 [Pirellulaceae bacterium]